MKKCGKCDKTVYPTEELKCLDKTWHKGCFRCWQCNMMLSMRNYKGYEKLPYCTTHCPKPKHTQVPDMVEHNRLAEQTKLQSQIKYHEKYEQEKGNKITIADDPETVRVRKTQGQVSQITYHDHVNKAQRMEQNRSLLDSEPNVSPSSPSDYGSPSYRAPVPSYTSPAPPAPSYGSANGMSMPLGQPMPAMVRQPEPDYHRQPEPAPAAQAPPQGPRYRAMYDYLAADHDEVSFIDGDLIINVQHIDEGWMTGTVERTQQSGMLPANYVTRI